jgi:AcrR family transcriptional regulator
VAEVATDLGITRKTVYRYFAGTEALFSAVSEVAVDRWIAQLEAATASLEDPRELLVETVAFIIETLPRDPLLSLLLATGHTAVFSEQMLTARSIAMARAILLSRQVDWPALGLDDERLDELVEHLIRVTQSMIVVPPHPPRTGDELRGYLRRWAVPALAPGAERG